MNWTDTINNLETRILNYIQQAKKEGTTGMSKDNLKMVIDLKGINLPNANAYYRAFNEATDNLEKTKKIRNFRIYE